MREEQRVGKALGLESEALDLHTHLLTATLGKLLTHAEFVSWLGEMSG